MICNLERHTSRCHPTTASFPSIPLKYRIQFRDDEMNKWRDYAHFRYPGEAEACLSLLLQRGIDARIETKQQLVRIDQR